MLEWASLRSKPDVQEANGPASSGGVPEPKTTRKTGISLALGGGCARGWAHIGVLRALDEAGIEVSMIAGTSIGALVGGCYLAGKLDELEEFARSLTKRRIFGLLDLNLRGSGLFGGMKLDARLREHVDGIRFEDLSKPFVAVASEIRTGHEIWLTHGRIVDAMRASYALPGIFSPVLVGDRWLVDGALVNPVPVSAARAFGAEIVIAANLSRVNSSSRTTRRAPVRSILTTSRTRRASASPASWSRPSTSSRTGFRAQGSPAIRLICRCSRSSAISA